MKKLLLGIIFISVTLLGVAFAHSIGYASGKKQGGDEAQAKILKAKSESSQKKEKQLEECLDKAVEKFRNLFVLNSYEAPQEGHPDARTWNDFDIQQNTEKKYDSDREFCLKLYK
jgi:hypothetical protein